MKKIAFEDLKVGELYFWPEYPTNWQNQAIPFDIDVIKITYVSKTQKKFMFKPFKDTKYSSNRILSLREGFELSKLYKYLYI